MTLLKFIFAGGIMYYMIATGKLDLHEVSQIAHKKSLIIRGVLIILAVYGLVVVRWYYLLIWQGIPVTFGSVLRISCIGLFFNSFMPGSIGGDLIKAFYVARENREYRTRAVVTVIIDRIIGFETLMIVAFVALLLNFSTISSNTQLRTIAGTVAFYIFCSLIAAVVVFSKRVRQFFVNIGVRRVVELLPGCDLLLKIYHAFHIYSNQKVRLLKAMAITVPIDILNIYLFFLIGREMGDSLVSLTSYFTLVPVGMLMMSLPISPAGLGIGQGAFYTLFLWFGASSGKIGATVVSVYQLLMISINMCFVFVYLGNRKDVKKAMLSAQTQQPL